jgi:hypothetical protein
VSDVSFLSEGESEKLTGIPTVTHFDGGLFVVVVVVKVWCFVVDLNRGWP